MSDRLKSRTILLFWAPLAAQWMMMAIESPFLAAVIARLADPTYNLAAYGVAYAIGILTEAPVIMLMSASTALVAGPVTFRRMRNFARGLNVFATGLLLFVLIPSIFEGLTSGLLALPPEVSELVRGALWIMLPWPAAIGYRRFLHGLLIRSGKTRLVAAGTAIRLVVMTGTAIIAAMAELPGAWVGAAALSVGVVVEAVVARVMARHVVRALTEADPPIDVVAVPEENAPGYREIARFYYPLALTSFIGLTVQPILTFFMGRAPSPVESLAVFPVVHSLSFFFRALGLSFQEAAIALIGPGLEHTRALGRFALGLGAAASFALGIIAFTPLAGVWFGQVSGLAPELVQMAIVPARIAALAPALSVALSFERAILVQQRRTRPITLATAIEVAGIAMLFPLFGWGMGFAGVTAAMLAFTGGRVAGVGYLALRLLSRRRPAYASALDRQPVPAAPIEE